jgi:glycosyltransferase involved in cell wall biosynthesis
MPPPTPNPRLHVLTLVDGIGTYGGAETTARDIAQGLDPDRFRSTLCVTRWEPLPEFQPALDELRAAGVEFIGMERKSKSDLAPWRKLAAHMRENQVDVLHSHKFGSNVWGALLAPRIPVPVFVAHEHTWSYSGNRMRVFLDRRLIARRADAFIAVSEEDRRRMIEVEKIAPSKTRFIASGIVDPPVSSADPASVRRELGIGNEAPVIGVVATLRSQKALDVLLRATALLHRDFPELTVLVAGGEDPKEPGEQERLEEVMRDLGIADSVRFLGRRDDVPDLVAAMDIGVLSSDYEGCPLSVMEYMEAGKPVVATAVGGLTDLVAEGVTGLLVPPQDPAAFAEAVSALLRDGARAKKMGAAGRERRRDRFDVRRTIDQVEALYEELAP